MNRLRILLKKIYYKKNNIIIGNHTYFNDSTLFDGDNIIGNNCSISSTKIGYKTYIGNGAFLDSVVIGKYCSIGDNCKVLSGTHPVKDWVSTHPCFYSKDYLFSFVNENLFKEVKFYDETNRVKVKIGNDVWIGSNVLILGGVQIGDGAVIGAGAVVTSDVTPYSIVGGVPAKCIRKRFDENTINHLIELKWWNLSFEELKSLIPFFNDVNEFLNNEIKK